MKNEKGVVLPLTLSITLIIALLLLQYSSRITSQIKTYELQQNYFMVTLLEKECLSLILEDLKDSTFLESDVFPSQSKTLHNQTVATFTYRNSLNSLDVTYKFIYNEYQGQGTISYDKTNKTYTWK
ncbi:MAG: hypothetical protein II005_10440 [Turicibacter sp.]|nr:hypothetical protein [Turicibacter sp.]